MRFESSIIENNGLSDIYRVGSLHLKTASRQMRCYLESLSTLARSDYGALDDWEGSLGNRRALACRTPLQLRSAELPEVYCEKAVAIHGFSTMFWSYFLLMNLSHDNKSS